jgi:hypothetical protein
LPTSIGGALIHVADHTQRHVGQVVTTAKVLKALRAPNPQAATAARDRELTHHVWAQR